MHEFFSVLFTLLLLSFCIFFFFFNDTATTEIYTLSLHDALPISFRLAISFPVVVSHTLIDPSVATLINRDRKSTRLNSSQVEISYAVFCLKKKTKQNKNTHHTNKQVALALIVSIILVAAIYRSLL